MSRRRIGFWYRFAAVIAKPLLVVLFRRDWRGMQHIPAEDGFITAINHNSYLDPISYAHFQYNTGRPPRFLAKDGLFKGAIGVLMRALGQIPVYRESTDAAAAFKAAVAAINSGECVAFYPEGTITRDPDLWPMSGKTGAARVALLTQAPVIPVAQWGAHEAMPPYAKEKPLRLWPRKTLWVMAGPPVDLSDYYGLEPTQENLRGATDKIMDAITELLSELRGEPAPEVRFDPRKARAETARKTRAHQERERARVERRPDHPEPGTGTETAVAGTPDTEPGTGTQTGTETEEGEA